MSTPTPVTRDISVGGEDYRVTVAYRPDQLQRRDDRDEQKAYGFEVVARARPDDVRKVRCSVDAQFFPAYKRLYAPDDADVVEFYLDCIEAWMEEILEHPPGGKFFDIHIPFDVSTASRWEALLKKRRAPADQ